MSTRTIDEVLAALGGVVERAAREGDRIGYFAAIYHTVTSKVREGLEVGFFDDADRMERLDVLFANRFLDALADHRRGQRPTRCWRAAFEAAAQRRPIVLQHLLVGINAHINLDLGVAAVETAPGSALPALRRDFDRINEILTGLVAGMRETLAAVSPWIGILDRVGGRGDDEMVRFSLTVARSEAWRFATELAPLPADARVAPIRARDQRVARLAAVVLHPGWLRLPLLVVRGRESNDVARVIALLSQAPPPSLASVEARVRDDHVA